MIKKIKKPFLIKQQRQAITPDDEERARNGTPSIPTEGRIGTASTDSKTKVLRARLLIMVPFAEYGPFRDRRFE